MTFGSTGLVPNVNNGPNSGSASNKFKNGYFATSVTNDRRFVNTPQTVAVNEVTIINVSANAVNFAGTAGVSELSGAFAAGQYDSIKLRYVTDRWVSLGRSDN